MYTEGELEFIHTLSLLKFQAMGLPCGLGKLIGFKKKKKIMNLKLVWFFFDPTVEPKALFVPGPEPEVVILIYKLIQDSKGAVTNYLK